jgi:hypothetical protein
MVKEDFVIQATVRRLLVRSNIDHSDLTFGTVRGVVYFRGIFKLGRIYIYGEDEKTLFAKSQDYIRKTLYSLEKKVRSIPGVRDVIFQFLNWKKEGGQWIPVKGKRRVALETPAPGMEKKPEGKWILVEKDGEWVVEKEEKEKGED